MAIILNLVLAFNALVSSCVTLQMLSFVMPAALVVYRKRSEEYLPKDRAFALPDWFGWVVNVWAVCMPSLLCIFFLFPSFLPVTVTNMSESKSNTLRERILTKQITTLLF